MKKIILYCLVFIIALSSVIIFTSCFSDSADGSAEDTTLPVDEKKPITIFENGQYNCVIVIPHKAPTDVENAAYSLSLNMSKVTPGISPLVVSDKEYDGKDTSGDNMILIGKTSIKGTEETFANSKYGAVYTQLIGNKFQVLINDSKSAACFNEKIKKIIGSSAVPSITIDESWNFSETLDEMMSAIEVYDGGYVDSTVDCGDGTFMKVIKRTSAEEYAAYIEKSKNAGATLHSENTIGDNLFTTMTFDGYNATFVYIGNLKESRLIVDPLDVFCLPENESENVYTEICSSSLTQVGGENGDTQNGMGYIFKLSDGRFVIIDGGHNKDYIAKKILATLRELAENPEEITIAAWFFSHFHGDHWGTFRKITNMEDNGIVVERIIYNLADDVFLNAVAESEDGDEPKDGISDKRVLVNEYFERHKANGTKLYKAHPGQVFHLANIDFTIYSTTELYAPIKEPALNNTCLVIRATTGGQSILFPGDSAALQSEFTIKMYGDNLKSDILQIIHHGYGGGDTDYYELVDPQILLWPVGMHDYLYRDSGGPVSKREINEYFFREEGTSLKEILVAGDSVTTIPLPYNKITKAD